MGFAPSLGPRLDLRQSQSLVMTPQLRQAIQILQFSNLEVEAFLSEELLRNPLLELDGADGPREAEPGAAPSPDIEVKRAENLSPREADIYVPGAGADRYGGGEADADGSWPDQMGAARPCLREHLEQQARLAFASREERLIAAALIAALDPSGRLGEAPDALAAILGVDPARLEAVRAVMMRFDPAGLFATSLAECLAAQLTELNRLDPAMQALLDHLDLLARREMRALAGICGVDGADLAEMAAELRRLDPKPGARFDSEPLRPLIPDVLMHPAPPQENGESDWVLEINPETMPRLLIRRGFHARLLASASKETRSYLAERMQSASWLVKSLESRTQTILRVAGEIVRRQEEFFRHGIGFLRPLTLRDIAAEVNLHESTVSRVTSNKSIATPRGVFELKFFFSTALAGTNGEMLSAEAVRHRVARLIAAESPKNILSDDAVAVLLQKEGIDIARRTVAKYREALRIPGSAQRRREKLPV